MHICRSLMLLIALAFSSPSHAEWFSEKRAIMGTEVSVTLWHQDTILAHKAIDAAMAELTHVDQTFSPYIETSELALLNAQAAKKVMPISHEMAKLIDRSLYFSDISGGAFDITFASVGWFYDYRHKKQPSSEQKKTLLPAINYRFLEFDRAAPSLHFAHENVRIDLGGIAKGYAVDLAIDKLKSLGVTHATVSAGGDSRLLGDKIDRPWVIGIKNPRADPKHPEEVVLTMPLDNVAVSTSGDYERYFIDEQTGTRVHHIINPKTGESARGIISATIIGPIAFDTDGLSTTVFVLGVDEGLKLINRLPGFDCVIIDDKGHVHYSDGLAPPAKR